jgi:EAL domain-containing protein (putative c-di-GMP-specific phosphodiesterase class I)
MRLAPQGHSNGMSASDKIFGWRARATSEVGAVVSATADVVHHLPPPAVLEGDLRRALLRNQFELHYQPQLDLRSGDILSFEALIRWRHPARGLLSPAAFLAAAEQFELMREIDDWVLNAAVDQALAWDYGGLPPFGVAINVSRAQFHRPGFAAHVEGILREKQLSPRRMEIEMTEDVLVGDTSTSMNTLRYLHDLGISLAIDDFGAGYSSLGDLSRLPIDELKIDRSFVNDMTANESAAGVVRSIIETARSLKFQVVAEGLETTEQLRRLMNMRCERAQGYLISRPIAPTQLARFLDEWPRRWHTLIS